MYAHLGGQPALPAYATVPAWADRALLPLLVPVLESVEVSLAHAARTLDSKLQPCALAHGGLRTSGAVVPGGH